MTAKKWVGVLVGAAAIWWIYGKYRFSQGVSFLITKIGIGGSFLNPEINLDVTIYNPTNISTSISNINAELFLTNGQKIADVYYNQKLDIKAKSQVVLPLQAVTTFSGAVNAISEVIRTKSANFKLTGTAVVDGIYLPFDINYNFYG